MKHEIAASMGPSITKPRCDTLHRILFKEIWYPWPSLKARINIFTRIQSFVTALYTHLHEHLCRSSKQTGSFVKASYLLFYLALCSVHRRKFSFTGNSWLPIVHRPSATSLCAFAAFDKDESSDEKHREMSRKRGKVKGDEKDEAGQKLSSGLLGRKELVDCFETENR